MPQIKSHLVPAFVDEVRAAGVLVLAAAKDASSLRPSQRELHEDNVQAVMASASLDKPVLVSSDGYVLDGHHRWAANARLGRQQRCIVLDANVEDALNMMAEFAAQHQELCAAKV